MEMERGARGMWNCAVCVFGMAWSLSGGGGCVWRMIGQAMAVGVLRIWEMITNSRLTINASRSFRDDWR